MISEYTLYAVYTPTPAQAHNTYAHTPSHANSTPGQARTAFGYDMHKHANVHSNHTHISFYAHTLAWNIYSIPYNVYLIIIVIDR